MDRSMLSIESGRAGPSFLLRNNFGMGLNRRVKDWRMHNNYDLDVSCNRIVTRSQIGFNVIHNTPSDLSFFADPKRQETLQTPHAMVTMKRGWGSIPNTVITRSMEVHLPIDEVLCQNLEIHKAVSRDLPQRKKKR